jgi:hypothetical protein
MVPMKKNTLIVFVVILVPIIIMGSLAVMGAENFENQKEVPEGGVPNTNSSVEIVPMPAPQVVLPLSCQFVSPTA